MKNSVVKILTVASLGLLISSTVVPANAQTAEETTQKSETTAATEKKAGTEKPQLSPDVRQWLAIGIGGIAVLAVMVGTGNSMKHEKEAKKKSRANRGISNPSVRS